jgi:hypothetical protein
MRARFVAMLVFALGTAGVVAWAAEVDMSRKRARPTAPEPAAPPALHGVHKAFLRATDNMRETYFPRRHDTSTVGRE